MERPHLLRNDQDRERLHGLVARLGDDVLRRPLAAGWTVAALAHLAFWDRWVAARWEHYDRTGTLEDLPDGIADLANAAALPLWLALPPREATALALAAAEETDCRIAALPAAAVAHALTTGRPVMVDRSLHRGPHLDEIERALAG